MNKLVLVLSLLFTLPAISQVDFGSFPDIATKNTLSRDQKEAIKIYPNPASDFIKVNHENIVTSLNVYNILGVRIKSLKVADSDSVDIVDLPKGMYFVQLLDIEGEIIKTVRFFKRNYQP